ncbi:MAG: hypothetical protein AABZ74_18445 [Cyanobacteriota bacterium]
MGIVISKSNILSLSGKTKFVATCSFCNEIIKNIDINEIIFSTKFNSRDDIDDDINQLQDVVNNRGYNKITNNPKLIKKIKQLRCKCPENLKDFSKRMQNINLEKVNRKKMRLNNFKALNSTTTNNNKKKIWVTQTQMGLYFGLSAIAIGKKLIELGLKDSKRPTKKAFDENLAKVFFYKPKIESFLWDKEIINLIKKITPLVNIKTKKDVEIDKYVKKAIKQCAEAEILNLKAIELDDSFLEEESRYLFETAFDDVPDNLMSDVKKCFYKKTGINKNPDKIA